MMAEDRSAMPSTKVTASAAAAVPGESEEIAAMLQKSALDDEINELGTMTPVQATTLYIIQFIHQLPTYSPAG